MPHPTHTAVVVVEDDDKVRTAMEIIIDGSPGLVCVATFEAAEPLLAAELGRVDVVLLDVGLPGMQGTDAIRPIRERWPTAEVLMLTVYQEADVVFEAMCAGAVGYLLKNTPPAQIVEAIRELRDGGAPMTPSVARQIVRFMHRQQTHDEALTDRENEVLEKVIDGKTNQQIADELFVSPNTVAYHLKQIYKKLHVHSRAEAATKALRRQRRS